MSLKVQTGWLHWSARSTASPDRREGQRHRGARDHTRRMDILAVSSAANQEPGEEPVASVSVVIVKPRSSSSSAEAVKRQPSSSAAEAVKPPPSASAAEAVKPLPSSSSAEAVKPPPSSSSAEAVKPQPSATSAADAVKSQPSSSSSKTVKSQPTSSAKIVNPQPSSAAEAVKPQPSSSAEAVKPRPPSPFTGIVLEPITAHGDPQCQDTTDEVLASAAQEELNEKPLDIDEKRLAADDDDDEKPLAARDLKAPGRRRARKRPRPSSVSAAAPAAPPAPALPFSCETCAEPFADRLSLAAHERRHGDGGSVFVCDDCHRTFPLPLALRRHRKRHNPPPPPHPSGRGPRATKRRTKTPRRYLDVAWGGLGLREARGAAPSETVACGVCDEQLALEEVRAHLAVPPDDGYFRCHQCLGVFGQQCQLSRHGCRQARGGSSRRSKRPRVARAPAAAAAVASDSESGGDVGHDSGSDWAAGEGSESAPAGADGAAGSARLACDVCQINFVSRRNLNRHRAQHEGGTRFLCEVCDMSYARLDDLTRHSQSIHLQKRQFRCPRCIRVFTQERIVEYHLRTHQTSGEPDATQVKGEEEADDGEAPSGDPKETGGADEADWSAAEDPYVDPPGPGPVRYTCETCGAGFDTRRRYTRHQQLRHDMETPRFFCEVCEASYARIDELTRHSVHVHRQKRNVPCPRCTRLFTQQRIVDYHVVGHDTKRVYAKTPRPFPCKQCRRGFRTEVLLEKHECRAGKSGSQRCVCDICGRGISCPQALKRHRLLHSDERPAKCQTCGMAFIDEYALSKHLLTHSEEKPFLCDHCGKGFRFKDYLIRHTRFHTGEKPYPCSACDKRFATSDTLSRHFLIHTGEKPFVCHVCARPFRQSQQLKTHMKVHERKELLLVLEPHEGKREASGDA